MRISKNSTQPQALTHPQCTFHYFPTFILYLLDFAMYYLLLVDAPWGNKILQEKNQRFEEPTGPNAQSQLSHLPAPHQLQVPTRAFRQRSGGHIINKRAVEG